MALDVFLALVMRLAAGIVAVQSPGSPVSAEQALSWATAIAYHADRTGLDPWELVGIARNETDFRPTLVGPDGKDCGITQIRVKYSKYKCKQLRRDAWLGFEEAARRLKANQAMCEKRHKWDLKRCRINAYNSGVRYAKKGRPGTYYLRVSCFAEAAKQGLRPVGDCRRVQNRGDIARLLKASRTADTQVATIASADRKPPTL